MANSALFHHTKFTTSHGSIDKIFPAQRQQDIINSHQTDSVKVTVRNSEWLVVQIVIGSAHVYFTTESELSFYEGDYGFEYLVNQFKPDYQAAVRESYNF